MATEYLGAMYMTVDGKDVELTDLNVTNNTGRKSVKTMNRTRRVKGFARGVGEYNITATAVIPTDGTAIDWGAIENSKITCYPDAPNGDTVSYRGYCVTEVGDKYTVDNEAVLDITGFAVNKVIE